MKRFSLGLTVGFVALLVIAATVSKYSTLQYNQSTYIFSPSNALASNILAGAFTTLTNTFASTSYVNTATGNLSQVLQPTNNTLTQVASGARPLLDPFVVIDNIAYYPTNPWVKVFDEEFIGDPTSSSIYGQNQFTFLSGGSGSTFVRLPISSLVEPGYLSMQTTSAALRAYFPATNSMFLTNGEFIFWSKVAFDNTNVTGEIRTSRFGFANLCNLTTAESATSVGASYVMVNTNLNTNSFVLVSAAGGGTTSVYSQHGSNVFTKMTWVNVGIRTDYTGLTNYLIVGLSPTNFVTVATNSSNVPSVATLSPFISVYGITAVGNVNRTNYFANFKLWWRPNVAIY